MGDSDMEKGQKSLNKAFKTPKKSKDDDADSGDSVGKQAADFLGFVGSAAKEAGSAALDSAAEAMGMKDKKKKK